MSAVPDIVTRAEQPYVAIRTRVTMADLGGLGARLDEVFAWLGTRGVPPAGPPVLPVQRDRHGQGTRGRRGRADHGQLWTALVTL